MMELPKELTPELLGLVLDEEIEEIKSTMDNTLYFNNKNNGDYVNIDTLTRLMKEWITGDIHKEFLCNLDVHSTFDTFLVGVTMNFDYDKLDNKNQLYGDTEFEAVLKAFEWVAKEKNLIDK